jgi:hypothetical protein
MIANNQGLMCVQSSVIHLIKVRQLAARQSTTFRKTSLIDNLYPALNISSSQSGHKPDFFCPSTLANLKKAGKISAILVLAIGIHYLL